LVFLKKKPADRRESVRYPIQGTGRIHHRTWTFPRECTVTDVSDGGARLFAEGMDPPEDFTLEFSNGQRRKCRVAWRLGPEFGVQFTDGSFGGFGKRVAGGLR
jgi:hypothetical protein